MPYEKTRSRSEDAASWVKVNKLTAICIRWQTSFDKLCVGADLTQLSLVLTGAFLRRWLQLFQLKLPFYLFIKLFLEALSFWSLWSVRLKGKLKIRENWENGPDWVFSLISHGFKNWIFVKINLDLDKNPAINPRNVRCSKQFQAC